jgi:hypothetical protein
MGLDFLNPLTLFKMPSKLLITIMLLYLFFSKKYKFCGNGRDSLLGNPSLFLSCLSLGMISFLVSPFSLNVFARLTSVCIIARMTWALDMLLFLLCGAILYEFMQTTFKTKNYSKYIVCASIASMFFCFAKNFRTPRMTLYTLAANRDFNALVKLIEPHSIVISPTLNKNIIPVFVDVLGGVRTHAKNERDADAVQEVMKLFKGDHQEALHVLSKLSADYIFLLLPSKDYKDPLYLEGYNNLLTKIFDASITPKERFVLYKINRESTNNMVQLK